MASLDAEPKLRSPFQTAILNSLESVLLPIVKLMLRCGLGCSEFISVAKSAYVKAATTDYSLRGRPTNASRVAALTGLSRKEVSRIRAETKRNRWTPDMEVTPANTVLHYWHFDPLFCDQAGTPRPLSFDGPASFTALVKRYVGDIPAGAMKKELLRARAIAEQHDGQLVVKERYFYPEAFDEDFVLNAAFALKNLGETLVHNAGLAGQDSDKSSIRQRRFERSAWTDRMDADTIVRFKRWVRSEGTRFIEIADNWIGENEIRSGSSDSPSRRRTVGVGLYFFEEDD